MHDFLRYINILTYLLTYKTCSNGSLLDYCNAPARVELQSYLIHVLILTVTFFKSFSEMEHKINLPHLPVRPSLPYAVSFIRSYQASFRSISASLLTVPEMKPAFSSCAFLLTYLIFLCLAVSTTTVWNSPDNTTRD